MGLDLVSLQSGKLPRLRGEFEGRTGKREWFV